MLEWIITLHRRDVNRCGFQNAESAVDCKDGLLSYYRLGSIATNQKRHARTIFGGKQEALILYTSGSTGEPKSMVFTNENILSTLFYYKNTMHPEKVTDMNRRWMCVVPFMYPYGFAMSVLVSIMGGYEAVLAPSIAPDTVADYYRKKPYLVFGSPAFLEMTKRNIPDDEDLSSVHYFISGGDFLSAQQMEAGKAYFKKFCLLARHSLF